MSERQYKMLKSDEMHLSESMIDSCIKNADENAEATVEVIREIQQQYGGAAAVEALVILMARTLAVVSYGSNEPEGMLESINQTAQYQLASIQSSAQKEEGQSTKQ